MKILKHMLALCIPDMKSDWFGVERQVLPPGLVSFPFADALLSTFV